jgi:hypothetical protein
MAPVSGACYGFQRKRRQLASPQEVKRDRERAAMTEEEAILTANAAYYRAFRMGDDALMGRVWHDGAITCVHPGWPPIHGRAAVLASYRGIMSNPNQPEVACQDEQVFVTSDMARVICVEAVSGVRLIATNLFLRSGANWRMIHHQASLLTAPMAAQGFQN